MICKQCGEEHAEPVKVKAGEPLPPQLLPFVAVGDTIVRGQTVWGRLVSRTFARRVANALNNYKPNSRGV